MRVAAYMRVSTSEQNVDLQRRDLAAFIEGKGWPLSEVSWYEDVGCTGTNGNRPQLRRLLNDVRARKVDLVLTWKLDRLFRSLRDLLTTLQVFEELGVVFVALKDAVDLSTSSGRLMMQLIGSFAEFEASLIRERTISGMQAAKRRGVRIGRRPLEVDIGTILLLRKKGQSFRSIAKQLGVSRSLICRRVSKGGLSSD